MDKYTTVSETIPLEKSTVGCLLDTLRTVFSSKNKPIRVVYAKDEPLTVDRRVRKEMVGESMVSAYQMVRQHSDISIIEDVSDPVMCLCKAAQDLHNSGSKTICIVANNKFDVYKWFHKALRPEGILGVGIVEDSDCPEDCVFICSSKTGTMVRDIEKSVLIRME